MQMSKNRNIPLKTVSPNCVIVTARNFLSKLEQAAQWFVNKFSASKN